MGHLLVVIVVRPARTLTLFDQALFFPGGDLASSSTAAASLVIDERWAGTLAPSRWIVSFSLTNPCKWWGRGRRRGCLNGSHARSGPPIALRTPKPSTVATTGGGSLCSTVELDNVRVASPRYYPRRARSDGASITNDALGIHTFLVAAAAFADDRSSTVVGGWRRPRE